MQLNLDGYTELPPGKLAAIATLLEMHRLPARPLAPLREDLQMVRVPVPDLDWYLGLFARIGEPWLWFSRRVMPRDTLAAILADPDVAVYRLEFEGREVGLVELDHRVEGEVELAFFGFVPDATGLRLGAAAMQRALQRAFAANPRRVWVHTCTLDHPAALPFYQKCGFRAYARAIEVVDDPRLTGALPPGAAPYVPTL